MTWYLDTIWAAIRRGLHTSTHNPDSTAFCCAEIADCIFCDFSLLLTAEAAILLFGRRLRISNLASVPQTNRKDRLICDSTARPSSGDSLLPPSYLDTPAVNVSTDMTVTPPSMQLGLFLSRLLQQIWEDDPHDGPVYL